MASSLAHRRVDLEGHRADEDNDDERVPSSQADDVAGPASSLVRSGLVEEKDDQGYETDDSERVPASDASPSPLSFRFVGALFFPALFATRSDFFPLCSGFFFF